MPTSELVLSFRSAKHLSASHNEAPWSPQRGSRSSLRHSSRPPCALLSSDKVPLTPNRSTPWCPTHDAHMVVASVAAYVHRTIQRRTAASQQLRVADCSVKTPDVQDKHQVKMPSIRTRPLCAVLHLFIFLLIHCPPQLQDPNLLVSGSRSTTTKLLHTCRVDDQFRSFSVARFSCAANPFV